jgi:hypothetical protein
MGFAPAMLGIHRAVRNDTIRGYGVEGRLLLQVDCIREAGYALFLRGTLDGALFNGASWWGPAIAFGVELGVRGKGRPEPVTQRED